MTRQFGAIAAKKSFMSEMCAVAIGNLVENARFHSNGEGDLRLEVVREGWGGVGVYSGATLPRTPTGQDTPRGVLVGGAN